MIGATVPAAAQEPPRPLRLAILQRVCPEYRLSLFKTLSAQPGVDARLFIGEDLPGTKVRSATDLGTLKVTRLPTKFVKFGRRMLPRHVGLVEALRNFEPDVILCESESHFIGYLQAIYYRTIHKRNTALIHWCFITLPGEDNDRTDLAWRLKSYLRRYFDAFVVYSSYSRRALIALGEPDEKIFTATNVGDVSKFRKLSEALSLTKSEARRRLDLPQRFTVLYAGTLDPNKRPEVLLELARTLDPASYNFVLVGSGRLADELAATRAAAQLENVYLRGRITSELHCYFRAADVLLLPGRGGVVVSEAMASGLPAVVHHGDGTEVDLVLDGVSGRRVSNGTAAEFAQVLENLRANKDQLESMAECSRRMIERDYNEQQMTAQILKAAVTASDWRQRLLRNAGTAFV